MFYKYSLFFILQFSFVSVWADDNKPRILWIPGPSFNVGYNQTLSAGIGFHLDIIKVRPGNRMGHWKFHNFLIDYDLNYFFSKDLHLSEELSMIYFYAYVGLFRTNWKPLVSINFAHHTDFTENSLAFSPSFGITKLGLIEFKVGYNFNLSQQNDLGLKDGITAGIFFRPLMKNHFAMRRPPVLIRDIKGKRKMSTL